jgi:flagellar basal body-associated protein FliL
MARPTKPKELKPKTEGDVAPAASGGPHGGASSSTLDVKFLILLVIMVLSSILGSAGSVYLMTSMLITPEIHKLAKTDGSGGEQAAESHTAEDSGHEVGMNLELDEFMVNLKPDPALGGSQYLRAKMALSIKAPDAENCYKTHAMTIPRRRSAPGVLAVDGQSGIIAGAALPVEPSRTDADLLANGGEGSGPPACEGLFKSSMGRFVPTIRDIVNASLMKRTASQLASQEGQETLKDEIKEQLSQIMAPDYEVLRVNFQDFIIQR